MLTGTGFNGNSEGAVYGDDWQMNTNYPIVSLVDAAGHVYYARTYNWNSTGVMRGKLPDTVYFTPPKNATHGAYTLYVSANGIHSDPFLVNASPDPVAELTVANSSGMRSVPDIISNSMKVYPNPVKGQAIIEFSLMNTTQVHLRLFDVNGKEVRSLFDGRLSYGDHSMQLNVSGLNAGIYVVRLITENGIQNLKLVRQ